MRGFVLVLLVAACGGSYDAEPHIADFECTTFDCPMVAGGEVLANPIYASDYTTTVTASDVAVTPSDLADVRLENNVIVLHPRAVTGTAPSAGGGDRGTLAFTVADSGERFERPISVAPAATTTVVPYEFELPSVYMPARLYAGGRMAMFLGGSLVVVAQHRASDGQRLLGHGLEQWTLSGPGELAEGAPSDDLSDSALVRWIRPTDLGEVTVSAGGVDLVLEVLPPRSTARLELERFGFAVSSLDLMASEVASVDVLAFASDGLYIQGGTVSVSVTDSSIVEVSAGDRGYVNLRGHRSGTANVTIELDGVTTQFQVTVGR